MLVGWMARRVTYGARTLAGQYFLLIVYVIAKTIIFIPMLYLADSIAPGAIQNAAQLIVLGAAGLILGRCQYPQRLLFPQGHITIGRFRCHYADYRLLLHSNSAWVSGLTLP